MHSLDLQDISKTFAHGEVLNSITIAVETGERIAVVGESGSGKTTLLRIIAGLEQPSKGSIKLNGLDVTGWAANQRGVGMVFQDYATYPRLTVAENLNVATVGNILSKSDKESRLMETAKWLGLEGMLRRFPAELSGGQLQRVALGKALMARPKILLLDEPFSQLDVRMAEQMRQLLHASHQHFGMTQVLVTHQPLDALCAVDKLAVLHQGRLAQFDTPWQVRKKPATLFAAELTSPCGLNVIPTAMFDGPEIPHGATVVFRPECVKLAALLSPGQSTEAVSFKCRLGSIRDLGIVRLREVLFHDHKLLISCPASLPGDAAAPNLEHMAAGEEVLCAVLREDLLLFAS